MNSNSNNFVSAYQAYIKYFRQNFPFAPPPSNIGVEHFLVRTQNVRSPTCQQTRILKIRIQLIVIIMIIIIIILIIIIIIIRIQLIIQVIISMKQMKIFLMQNRVYLLKAKY